MCAVKTGHLRARSPESYHNATHSLPTASHPNASERTTAELAVNYLELLQRLGDDRLAGRLFLAQSHQPLDGLLESFPLNYEMCGLRDN